MPGLQRVQQLESLLSGRGARARGRGVLGTTLAVIVVLAPVGVRVVVRSVPGHWSVFSTRSGRVEGEAYWLE